MTIEEFKKRWSWLDIKHISSQALFDDVDLLLLETEKENLLLRKMLWLRHGCEIYELYGDDGELQCSKCMIDFKRDSVINIQKRWDDLILLKLKTDEELKLELKKLFPPEPDNL